MRLPAAQQRAWMAYIRVYLRLTYEMNRQLRSDSDLSLADYDVLNALRHAEGNCLRVQRLAAMIGWERSRVSHQVRRLRTRGLVDRDTSAEDGRGTVVALTEEGRARIRAATKGHQKLVASLFFGGLDQELLEPLAIALEQVNEHILEFGTLPTLDEV